MGVGAERRAKSLVAALVGRHRRAHRLVERVLGVERLSPVIGQHGKERQARTPQRSGKLVQPIRRDKIEKGRCRHCVDAVKQPARKSLRQVRFNDLRLEPVASCKIAGKGDQRRIVLGEPPAHRNPEMGHPEMRRQRPHGRAGAGAQVEHSQGAVAASSRDLAKMIGEGGTHIRVAGAKVRRFARREPVTAEPAHERVLAGSAAGAPASLASRPSRSASRRA